MYVAGIGSARLDFEGDRHRGRRTAIVGAAAAAVPILALGNQWMESWRNELRDFGPDGRYTGFGVRSLLSEFIDAFSWRLSGEPWSTPRTMHDEQMLGGRTGVLVASCAADAVAIALVGLLLWWTARTWRPGTSALAVFVPTWGVAIVACAVSGLVIAAPFGSDRDIFSFSDINTFLLGSAAERAQSGMLLGIVVGVAVMVAQAVHNARHSERDSTPLAGTDPLSPSEAPPLAEPGVGNGDQG